MHASDESVRPAATPPGLFVGRQAELAQLRDALRLALQGRGQLMLMAGSAGIGKTRTALELATEAERLQATVLWGRCLEEPGAPPYCPWIQIIRAYAGERGADAGIERGGHAAAVAFSLIETAKLNRVEPYAWLRDVLQRINDHPVTRLEELLPMHWKPA
jgi:predicted ATPase